MLWDDRAGYRWLVQRMSWWISLVLVCALILLTWMTGVWSRLQGERYEDSINPLIRQVNTAAQKVWPLQKKIETVDYLSQLATPKPWSFYEEFLLRDIFHPYVVESQVRKEDINPYELREVIRREMPLVWQGSFARSNGEGLFAQINVDNDTYFVQNGDKIMHYQIVDVTPYYVDVQLEGDDRRLRLEEGRKTIEGPLMAKIYNKQNGKMFIAREGEDIEGFSIRSIGEDDVRMRKGDVVIYVQKKRES